MAVETVDVQALISAAVDAAVAVADASEADEYVTRQAAEAAIGTARAAIQEALDAVRDEYGNDGFPTARALTLLAASLLDLNRALAEDLRTVEKTLTIERGILDLALELYGEGPDTDIAAWAEALLVLNPGVRNPNRIPAGTTLTVYVQ